MAETLTKEERETTITFDETPADATIFTYNKTWQAHLEKKLGLKPIMNNRCGGREYRISKNRITPPRAPRKISAATLERLRKQGSKTPRQKSPNLSINSTVQPKTRPKTFSAGKTITPLKSGKK